MNTAAERMRAIWADALGRDEIRDDDDFLGLGGDSLSAVAITSRIAEQFGVEIGLADFFACRDFAELLGRITERPTPPAAGLRRIDRDQPIPPSIGQQRLLSLAAAPDAEPPVLLQFGFRVTGPLDAARLRAALRTVLDRHELLRTGFGADGQQIHGHVPDPLRWISTDETQARAMLHQVQAHDYNPPKRERILEWQSRQDFPICPNSDDPAACNLYQELRFPEGIYENINEFWEEQPGSQAHNH